MKQIISTVLILLLVGILAITFNILPSSVAGEDHPGIGVLDDIGTHFELPDFNVSITTNTTVHIFLRAYPSEMICYFIENASEAMSTQLTLGYLKPFTTYYMIEDSLVNENGFTTDDIGSYTYTQDLSEPHHVFIQPISSTIYISQSTTLHSDVHETVAITSDNVVLDLNGYNIFGTQYEWFGVDLGDYRNNVTVKNGGIRNCQWGVYLGSCTNVTVSNITMSSNYVAMEMSGVWSSSIIGNTFTSTLECGWYSSGNKIYHNNFIGAYVSFLGNTRPNSWDDGYPSGGNYWSYYTGLDLYHGPSQDILGSDGIGDSPYAMVSNNNDHYPLMNSWTPMETVVKIGGMDEPVTMLSNTTIGKIVVNKNNLKFTASGLTGQIGYVNLIFPMVNTSAISVSIDHKNPASPFPIISTDGTYYFIYFEFALSTHIVTIQFAPSITAIVNIDPDTLNLKSSGQWITGYIELTDGYDVNNIDVSTVMLNGTVPAELQPTEVGDYDGDGVPDLMVKLNRTEASKYICDVQNIKYGNVTLTIKGELYDGTTFEGSDTIRVRMPGDVNCDGKVDGRDVSPLAKRLGNSSYDLYYDMNEDGKVDGRDLALVCRSFGNTYQ